MGFLDAFSRDDRIELPVPELVQMLREACAHEAENRILRNAIIGNVPAEYIFVMLDGKQNKEE